VYQDLAVTVRNEPTLDDIRAQYPGWHLWIGADELLHGSPKEGIVRPVSAESFTDLQDQIRQAGSWIGMQV
jgi:hypothetical protein